MPYCTIEEAWGQPKNKNELKGKNQGNLQYAPFLDSTKDNRNYQLLPEHWEKEPRQKGNIKHKTKTKTTKSKSISKPKLKMKSNPTSKNDFFPKPDFELNEIISEEDTHQESVIEDDVKEKINMLIRENNKMKLMLQQGGVNNENDTIFDLILFISTGIFILFLLDMIGKAIRRF